MKALSKGETLSRTDRDLLKIAMTDLNGTTRGALPMTPAETSLRAALIRAGVPDAAFGRYDMLMPMYKTHMLSKSL